MTKGLNVSILTVMLIIAMAMPVMAQSVTVTVNGTSISFPDQQPYIDSNNRTLVPMRAPMEAMGCTVSWNGEKQQAIIKKDGIVVVFTIGSNLYTVNGETKTMNTEVKIIGGRTCIPIRYAAEAFAASVYWDANTYTAVIALANDEYYVSKGYIIPVKNNIFINTSSTLYIANTHPIIQLTLDAKNSEIYNTQIKEACNIIASRHGTAITQGMRQALQSKDDVSDIIDWTETTNDGLYKIEVSSGTGYAVKITAFNVL